MYESDRDVKGDFTWDPPPSGPQGDPFADQLRALYAEFGREPTPQDIEIHRGNPGGLAAIRELLQRDQPGRTEDPGSVVAPPPGPDPTPSPTPSPQPGSLIQPFTQPYQGPPTPQPLPTVGGSQTTIGGAPAFPNIPRFAGPTFGEAMDDPGYQFVLDQGNKNLQHWAAARGTLNDSSTAKALTDYGQGAAATQYGNVWDRAFNTYNTNVQTQYMDPWQAQYQNWVTGTVGPTMTNYSTNAANVSHQNDVNWQDNWNKWLQNWNVFRDQRDSTFDKQFAVAGA